MKLFILLLFSFWQIALKFVAKNKQIILAIINLLSLDTLVSDTFSAEQSLSLLWRG